jgi:hypothetical protein
MSVSDDDIRQLAGAVHIPYVAPSNVTPHFVAFLHIWLAIHKNGAKDNLDGAFWLAKGVICAYYDKMTEHCREVEQNSKYETTRQYVDSPGYQLRWTK